MGAPQAGRRVGEKCIAVDIYPVFCFKAVDNLQFSYRPLLALSHARLELIGRYV